MDPTVVWSIISLFSWIFNSSNKWTVWLCSASPSAVGVKSDCGGNTFFYMRNSRINKSIIEAVAPVTPPHTSLTERRHRAKRITQLPACLSAAPLHRAGKTNLYLKRHAHRNKSHIRLALDWAPDLVRGINVMWKLVLKQNFWYIRNVS